MINGLICKVFHKKEVCVEDVVTRIKSLIEATLILVVPPVLSGYWLYKSYFCEYDPTYDIWDFFTSILGVFSTLFTLIIIAAIVHEYYIDHKKDIIAVCPNARNEEEKKE